MITCSAMSYRDVSDDPSLRFGVDFARRASEFGAPAPAPAARPTLGGPPKREVPEEFEEELRALGYLE